ncbi:MAG: SEC-C metal-binding domain-containing protein [Candidatus Thiodiazotropha endolucinida]
MNSVQHQNRAPAVCNQCGFIFPSPFSLAGTRNSAVVGCATNCPKCGGSARILDSFTDSAGRLYVKDLFDYIQNYRKPQKLEELKNNLEAANDEITAGELADTLLEIEPGFSRFSELIKSLPGSAVTNLVTILISLITLVITYQTWVGGAEEHEEKMEIERAQLEIARENLEYQKQMDKEQENQDKQAELEREKIKAQIEQLKLNFEKKLKDAARTQPSQTTQTPTKGKTRIKGNQRNKPCPCGSGLKAKKCHPNGFLG